MSESNTGGPAFPTMNEHQNSPNTYHFEGMTLRDYFAAKAMQAILSNNKLLRNLSASCDGGLEDFVAILAYDEADAMINQKIEREKS